MEWSKIKNIIILILLATNGLLLGLMLYQDSASRARKSELITAAVAVLADSGVTVERELVPEGQAARPVSMQRDITLEETMARTLLGPCQSEAAGTTYTYVSANGSAIFRSTGDFVVTYSAQGAAAPAEGESPAGHGLALLEEAGLSCRLEGEELQGGQTLVTVCQTWEDIPVFSCGITLVYDDQQRLLSIQGRRLMARQGQPLQQETLTAPTALVRFLSAIVSGGEVCNQITAIEPGYEMRVSLTAPISLSPVWHVSTDTGRFSVDLLSGETLRLS